LFIKRKFKKMEKILKLVERTKFLKLDSGNNVKTFNPNRGKYGRDLNKTIHLGSKLNLVGMFLIDKNEWFS